MRSILTWNYPNTYLRVSDPIPKIHVHCTTHPYICTSPTNFIVSLRFPKGSLWWRWLPLYYSLNKKNRFNLIDTFRSAVTGSIHFTFIELIEGKLPLPPFVTSFQLLIHWTWCVLSLPRISIEMFNFDSREALQSRGLDSRVSVTWDVLHWNGSQHL